MFYGFSERAKKMNRRTFLKGIGAAIASVSTGVGLAKKNKETQKLTTGVDPAQGESLCTLQIYGMDDNGTMRLLGTDFVDYDCFIPAKYDDHELHVKAYSNLPPCPPLPPALRAYCEACKETLKEASEPYLSLFNIKEEL